MASVPVVCRNTQLVHVIHVILKVYSLNIHVHILNIRYRVPFRGRRLTADLLGLRLRLGYRYIRSALERNHRDEVTVWRLGLENEVFYLPDILSPKIQDNPEMSMVLRFRIILNVMVRIRVRVRIRIWNRVMIWIKFRIWIRILTLILTLILIVNLTIDVLPLVTFNLNPNDFSKKLSNK